MTEKEIIEYGYLAKRAQGLGIFVLVISPFSLLWDLYKVSTFASYANVIHKKSKEQENKRI
jgi:hypothetical protein